MSEPIDFTKFDSDDFKYVLHLIPRETLDTIADGLRIEVAELSKKQKSLNILDLFFKDNPKPKEPDKPDESEGKPEPEEGRGKDRQESESNSTSESTTPDKNSDLQADNKEKPKKTFKNRGTIEERYIYLKDLFEKEDNWIYVLEIERQFLNTGWVDEDDNVKEVVRGFLRQATEREQLIFETVYRINPESNKVESARMYALPSTTEDEKAFNLLKLEERVSELGLFMTVEEGLKARNTKAHGNQLGFDA